MKKRRAPAGEQAEHLGTLNIGRQPVEQRLAHAVRRRPQAGGHGEVELARAPLPADDPQPAIAAVGGVGFWRLGSLAHQCSGTPVGCSAGLSVGGGSSFCAPLGPAVTITRASGLRCLAMAALTCSTLSASTSRIKSSR